MDNIIDLDDLLIFEEFQDTPPNTDSEPDEDDVEPTPDSTDAPEPEPATEEEPTPDSSQLTNYYEILKETNLISVPDDFEFDGTEESLEKAFEITRQSNEMAAAQSLWERLPEDFKPLIQYALKGGTSLQDYVDAYSNPLEKLDASTTEGQRKIMLTYYKTTSKASDEKIGKMINRLEDDGDLETEALETLQELNELRAQQQHELLEQAEKDAADRRLRAAQQVQALNESIEKFPDPVRQSKIKAFFFNAVEKPQGGKSTEFDLVLSSIKDNPQHLVQLADIFLEYDPKAGFNLERYIKQGKTQATKKLSTLLEDKLNSKSKVKGTGSESQTKDNFDWKDYFNY